MHTSMCLHSEKHSVLFQNTHKENLDFHKFEYYVHIKEIILGIYWKEMKACAHTCMQIFIEYYT